MRRALRFEHTSPEPDVDADERTHEFLARVRLGPDDLDSTSPLHVGGVATAYDVLVNGAVVLGGTSMFARHVVDVGAHLGVGDNEVLVRCHPLSTLLDAVPRRPRARWRTWLVDEPRLRWVRTTILGRAPGFAPGPPVVGPWRPVVLETGPGPRVNELLLHPSVSDGAGILDVELVASGADFLLVEVSGPTGSVGLEVPLVGGRGRTRIELPDVARWWPHTHGTPTLYDVRVRVPGASTDLELPGDGTGATHVRRVGFRALGNGSPTGRPDTALESVDLHVNGVPVFVRGAVWTPGDLTALDTAAELGLNLVRVSGVSAYESDAFHERCDELGLLVWQDLMFATLDYPLADPDFVSIVETEVVGEARRLLHHPSTVVVCGSAEHEQQAAFFGVDPHAGAELGALLRPLVEGSGIDALWVASSPTGGDLPVRVGTGVAQYFGVGAYLRGAADPRHVGVRFAAECLAFANMPDDDLDDGAGVPRDNGADWDFADVREHYLRERHGPDATRLEAQQVTGELMAEVFGEWRRLASTCHGAIVLWLRDLTPGAGWGLLDHRGRPKPCARLLAPVLAPTAIWLLDEGLDGLDVHVAHDGPAPVEMQLDVELLRADGSALEQASTDWSMPARGHRVLGVEELIGHFVDASYAYRFGPSAHVCVRAELRGDFGTRTATWRVPR